MDHGVGQVGDGSVQLYRLLKKAPCKGDSLGYSGACNQYDRYHDIYIYIFLIYI